ncbi:unnamed protein product [Leptosia nina]|uniref:tyrosinase n=1 Tax=Leptosia nina TaxID=320188 RepID=A0AAV1JSB6_9NEOP
MSEEMQQDAVDCATQALEKFNIEKDIAAFIKKEFDKKYNPTWHCIVGRNFGSYVTHETRHFIYFYLGQVAILLFKSEETVRGKMANKRNLLLFFDRPTEPCFMQKGEKTVFELPDNFYPEKYKAVSNVLANRFGDGASDTISVNNIALPNLSLPLQLPYNAQFSLWVPKHRKMAANLIDIFMGMRTLDDLQSICSYCQMRINPYLFNYCLSVSILHREDTRGLNLPTFAETFPDKFMDPRVFRKAREVATVVPTGNRMPIVIPQNYTASEAEPEQRVAYFREDIGINLHHWHWHLVYPFDASDRSIVAKDRRGELFYYMHQQIIARYTAERYCNNLSAPRRYNNFREPIEEGYFPKLDSQVASRAWPPRFAGSVIQDLHRPVDEIRSDVSQMEDWRARFIEAIDSMSIMLPSGRRVPLDEATGIDNLGNMMESSIISPNRPYYGDMHNMGHVFISYSHDPDHRNLEQFGVMGDSATAMRDPVFYRWHAYVDDLFVMYKNKLTPYSNDKLDFSGIRVMSVGLEGSAGRNQISTQWEQSTVDLGRGLDFTPRGSVLARFTHLTHDDFSYVIEVNNTSGQGVVGTVRLFMAPVQDERGGPLNFNDQRRLMIELDKFTENLPSGSSTIRRSSVNSSVTIPYERTFRRQADRPGDPGSGTAAEFDFCGCGWPHHMLVPKGTTSGTPYVLFCMISDWNNDRVVQADVVGSCNDAASYCGLRDRKYPDKEAMGYPFDRPIPVSSLNDFLTPNMNVSDFVIRFKDQVRQHQGKPGMQNSQVTQSAVFTDTSFDGGISLSDNTQSSQPSTAQLGIFTQNASQNENESSNENSMAIFSVFLLVVCEPQQESIAGTEYPSLYQHFDKTYGWNADNIFDENNRYDEVHRSILSQESNEQYDSSDTDRLDGTRHRTRQSNNEYQSPQEDSDEIDKKVSIPERKNQDKKSNGRNHNGQRDINRDKNNDDVDGRDDKGDRNRKKDNNEGQMDRDNGRQKNYERDQNKDSNNEKRDQSNEKDRKKEDRKGRDEYKESKDSNNEREYDSKKNREREDRKKERENDKQDRSNGYSGKSNNDSRKDTYNEKDREKESKVQSYSKDDKQQQHKDYELKGVDNNDEKPSENENYKQKNDNNHRKENRGYEEKEYQNDERRNYGKKEEGRILIPKDKYDNNRSPPRYSYLESLITAPILNNEKVDSDYKEKNTVNNAKNNEQVIEIHGFISKDKENKDDQVKVDVIVKKADVPSKKGDLSQNSGQKIDGGIHIQKVIDKELYDKNIQISKPLSNSNNGYNQKIINQSKNYREGYSNYVQEKKELLGGIELLGLISNLGQEIKEQVIEKIPGYHFIQSLDPRGQKSKHKEQYLYEQEKKHPKIDLEVYSPEIIKNEEMGKVAKDNPAYSKNSKSDSGFSIIKETEIDSYTKIKNKEGGEKVKVTNEDKKYIQEKEIDIYGNKQRASVRIVDEGNVIKVKEDNYEKIKGRDNKESVDERRGDYNYAIHHKSEKNKESKSNENNRKIIDSPKQFEQENTKDREDLKSYSVYDQKKGDYRIPNYTNDEPEDHVVVFQTKGNDNGIIKQDKIYPVNSDGYYNQGYNNEKTTKQSYDISKQRKENYIYDYVIGSVNGELSLVKKPKVNNFNVPPFSAYNSRENVYKQDDRYHSYEHLYSNGRPVSDYTFKQNQGWSHEENTDYKKDDYFNTGNRQQYNIQREPKGYGYLEPNINKGYPENFGIGHNPVPFGPGYNVYQPPTYSFSGFANQVKPQNSYVPNAANLNRKAGYQYEENNYKEPYYNYDSPSFSESNYKQGYDTSYQGSSKAYVYEYQLPFASAIFVAIVLAAAEPQGSGRDGNGRQISNSNSRDRENHNRNDRQRDDNARENGERDRQESNGRDSDDKRSGNQESNRGTEGRDKGNSEKDIRKNDREGKNNDREERNNERDDRKDRNNDKDGRKNDRERSNNREGRVNERNRNTDQVDGRDRDRHRYHEGYDHEKYHEYNNFDHDRRHNNRDYKKYDRDNHREYDRNYYDSAHEKHGPSHPVKHDSEYLVPVKHDSGYLSPVKHEPVYEPPVKHEPVYVPPVKHEPVYVPPVKHEPVYVPPVKHEPVYVPPVKHEPVYVPPVKHEPVYLAPLKHDHKYLAPIKPNPSYVPAVNHESVYLAPVKHNYGYVPPIKYESVYLPPVKQDHEYLAPIKHDPGYFSPTKHDVGYKHNPGYLPLVKHDSNYVPPVNRNPAYYTPIKYDGYLDPAKYVPSFLPPLKPDSKYNFYQKVPYPEHDDKPSHEQYLKEPYLQYDRYGNKGHEDDYYKNLHYPQYGSPETLEKPYNDGYYGPVY